MGERLTPKESAALHAIVAFQEQHGRRPKMAELGAALGITAARASHYVTHLHYLRVFAGRMPCGSQAECSQARRPPAASARQWWEDATARGRIEGVKPLTNPEGT